jgi:5-methylcytosine-specific restriction endonuclease McrA
MTKKNLDPQMTSAGPVTIKRADGTVEIQPPYKQRIPRDVVQKVWKRDGQQCRYCGTTDGEFRLDPLRPGKPTLKNLVVACLPCILKKGDAIWMPRVKSKYGRRRTAK